MRVRASGTIAKWSPRSHRLSDIPTIMATPGDGDSWKGKIEEVGTSANIGVKQTAT